MLDALYPLLALLELDGEIVTPEDKVRAMNQKGGAALERLAEIRNHHLPPEGFAKERAAQHAAATQMQATFRGHHQRSEAQRIHDEEVAGRYREIWGDMGRCGEMWGDMGSTRPPLARAW